MKNMIYILSLMVILVACKKTDVAAPDFDVTVNSATVKAGQPLTFNFSGNPDVISFYSGEAGFKYENKDRTVIVGGKPTLDFATKSTGVTQANTLRILVSSNFTGVYDTTTVRTATWQDITDKFTISTNGTTATASGSLDLSPYAQQDGPLFFAFKNKLAGSAGQGSWVISAFNVNNTLSDGSVVNISTIATGGWLAADFLNTGIKWTISSTQLSINGTTAAPYNPSEDWVITKVLYVNKITPDVSVVVKNISALVSNYTYTFSQPGVYNVVFVAANSTIYGQKQITRQLAITVTP